MPVGVLATYEKLMYNLNNLHSELKMSSENENNAVKHCCEVINHLIDETCSLYREIKIAHDKRAYIPPSNVKDDNTEISSDTSYRAKTLHSLQSRTSLRSRRIFHNKPSSVKSNTLISLRNYSKVPRLSQNYHSIEHAEIERASIIT